MTFKDRIKKVRDEIAGIKAERNTIESQRKSRKEVGTQVDASLEHWSKEAEAIMRRNMARAAAGYPADFLTVHVRGMSVDLGPLFVLLLGPVAVRNAMDKGLQTVPEGLTPLVRARRLKESADALHLVLMEEERLIREAEQAGEIIPYRADADPAYTLTWKPE